MRTWKIGKTTWLKEKLNGILKEKKIEKQCRRDTCHRKLQHGRSRTPTVGNETLRKRDRLLS